VFRVMPRGQHSRTIISLHRIKCFVLKSAL